MRTPSIAGKPQYKFLSILFCLFITLQFICDLLVLRIINIGVLSFTASSAIFCLNFAIIDVIANVYGMQEAKRIAFLNLFCQILVALFLYTFLYALNPEQYSNPLYVPKARELKDLGLFLASNMIVIPISVLIGNLSNSFIMAVTKYLFLGRFIAIRSVISSLIGALLMLTLAYTKIYWDFSADFIAQLIASSMVVKVLGALIFMFPSKIISNALKQSEGIDVYDLKLKFLKGRQDQINKKFSEKL